jgi:hypothetical protein
LSGTRDWLPVPAVPPWLEIRIKTDSPLISPLSPGSRSSLLTARRGVRLKPPGVFPRCVTKRTFQPRVLLSGCPFNGYSSHPRHGYAILLIRNWLVPYSNEEKLFCQLMESKFLSRRKPESGSARTQRNSCSLLKRMQLPMLFWLIDEPILKTRAKE